MKARNRILLDVFTDNSTGVTGLALHGMPRNDDTNAATSGLLLGHDLLEHMNGPEEIGTITDELEALGAIWYVRGQHGELNRNGVGSAYTLEENIASDVTRMFRDFFHGAHVDLARIRTRPTDADDAFREIIEISLRDAPSELDQEERSKRETRARLREYIAVCLPRMRIGYRKAARKYEKHGRFFANNLFWAVVEAVDRALKHAELMEGQQFELHYGIDTDGDAFAHCGEYYGEE